MIMSQEPQIHSSLARIELGMEAFAADQRELCRLIKDLQSDFIVRHDTVSHVRRTSHQFRKDTPRVDPLVEHSDKPTGFSDLAIVASKLNKSSLNQMWPVTLPRRTELEAISANVGFGDTLHRQRGNPSIASMDVTSSVNLEREYGAKSNPYIILPASHIDTLTNIMALLLLSWDFVLTPLQMAWDLSTEGWLFRIAVMIALFWTSELFMSFRTAFYTAAGDLETRPLQIAIHYVRGQFFIDVVIVMCDWLNIIMGAFPSGLSLIRALKVTRVVRLFRAVRLTSRETLDKHIAALGINSEILGNIKILTIGIWLTHIIACAWFAIGRTNSGDTGFRWVDSVWTDDSPTFAEAHISFQYSSALQWTLTTMVSGSSTVIPLNSIEQTYSCTAILIGLLGQAVAVALLSTSIIEQKAQQRQLTATMSSLQKFCSTHRVQAQLGLIARSQVRAFFIERTSAALTLDQVEGLQIVATKIRSGILRDVFEPCFTRHSLFLLISHADKQTLAKILNSNILQLMYVQTGHDVFTAGDASSRMYLLTKGMAEYMQEPESSKEGEVRSVYVSLDTWYCEPALWTQWIHVGTLEVTSKECDVHCLSVGGFLEIAGASAKLSAVLREYGTKFHKRITESVPPHAPWPSDIETHGTNFAAMLIALPASIRKQVAALSVDCAVSLGLWNAEQCDSLMEEVDKGKSSILLRKTTSHITMERVVSVARVTVHSDDGRLFVELGQLLDGHLVVKCELPGAKQCNSEDITVTVARVVDRLQPCVGDINLIDTVVCEAVGQSTRTGIPTHYYFFDAFYTQSSSTRHCKFSMSSMNTAVIKSGSQDSTNTSSSDLDVKPRKSFVSRVSNVVDKLMRVSPHAPNFNMEAHLEDKLVHEQDLWLTRASSDRGIETYLCAWLTEAEFDFMRSEQGNAFATRLFQDEGLIDAARLRDSKDFAI